MLKSHMLCAALAPMMAGCEKGEDRMFLMERTLCDPIALTSDLDGNVTALACRGGARGVERMVGGAKAMMIEPIFWPSEPPGAC